MNKHKTITAFLLLSALMVFAAAFPLLLAKANDQHLLGQIQVRKMAVRSGSHSQYSTLDKLRLLYDKRVNSRNIVVVKNEQLPETDLENIKASCLAELQQLQEKKLFPDLEENLSAGFNVTAFTCSDTSKSDLAVNFYIIGISSDQYRISFTMDADTHKIYELAIHSAGKRLVIDYDKAPLNWQDYLGLSLVQGGNSGEAAEGAERNDNRLLPGLNSMNGVPEGDDTNGPSQLSDLERMAKVLADDYSDGSKIVAYFFLIANDQKSFTITWSFQ